MDSRREDRIYVLQQALVDLDPAEWRSFLDGVCGDDASLRDEVMRRQRDLTRGPGAHTPSPAVAAEQDHLSTITGTQTTNRRPGLRLHEGQAFGSYRIVRLLGRGGMGEVYEADDVDSGRRVALKVLNVGFASDRDRRRFLREGQLAAALSHPHTVYVFGSEEIDGVPVHVIELVRGGTLADRVKTVGPLRVTEAVDVVLDVIQGLEAAAHLGILHRDVKPANCFVAEDGRVKVGDFGLSTTRGAIDHTHLTAPGSVLGTPAFAAPEQLRGEELDERADIYSVGATLFYLLLGRAPFRGDDAVQTIGQVLTAAPEVPHHHRSEIPRALSLLVLSCLAKTPNQRPQTYAALVAALEPFSSASPQSAALVPRTVAALIDGLVFVTLGMVASSMVGWPIGWTEQQAALGRLSTQVVIGIAYFTLLEGMFGASLGKRLCRLRVVSRESGPLALVWTLVRSTIVAVALRALPLFWALTESWETVRADPPGPQPIDLVGCSMGLILFVTARPWNGWRGVHEFASHTSTVADVGSVAQIHSQAPSPPAIVRAVPVQSIGPYRIVSRFQDDPFTVLGHDERLKRRVWIRLSPDPIVGSASARRDLARASRFRWLGGKHTTVENWDAYEHVDGQPWLRAKSAPRSFQAVAQWLESIARECRDGYADGTLEVIAVDRLWLTQSSEIKISDWPIPLSASAFASEKLMYPVGDAKACQQFLAQVAERALDVSGCRAAPYSVPLSGRALLTAIRQQSFETLDALIDACRKAVLHESNVTSRRRAALLAPVTLLVLASSTAEIQFDTDILRRSRERELESCVGQLSSIEAGRLQDDSGRKRHAAALCVSAFSRNFNARSLRTAMESGRLIPPTWISLPDAAALIESTWTTYPSASRSDLVTLKSELPFNSMVTGWGFVWQKSSTAALLSLAAAGFVCVALSALFGHGPLYLALGITLARSDGRPATRARIIIRSLVIWLPTICAALVISTGPSLTAWKTILALTSLAAMVTASIYGIRHPHRGIAERLTGTVLVRR